MVGGWKTGKQSAKLKKKNSENLHDAEFTEFDFHENAPKKNHVSFEFSEFSNSRKTKK